MQWHLVFFRANQYTPKTRAEPVKEWMLPFQTLIPACKRNRVQKGVTHCPKHPFLKTAQNWRIYLQCAPNRAGWKNFQIFLNKQALPCNCSELPLYQ